MAEWNPCNQLQIVDEFSRGEPLGGASERCGQARNRRGTRSTLADVKRLFDDPMGQRGQHTSLAVGQSNRLALATRVAAGLVGDYCEASPSARLPAFIFCSRRLARAQILSQLGLRHLSVSRILLVIQPKVTSTVQVMHHSWFLMLFTERLANYGQEFIILNRLL
jgi:hypothetical protein